ncbi:GNAT family acetyltransferase [Hansschlegelia sp.]|uniref:GNAT family acetyltransferase n=1 Tax=Hansschlegelia sp. TaxID=2041892 RepID=UPI0039C85F37
MRPVHAGSPPDLLIREMEDRDVDGVISVWNAAGVARPWNDPSRDLAFARSRPYSTVLVACLTAVAATVMVGEDGHRGWVYYLAVDPEHQGRGFGRAMMEAAERWLAARGVWKLQLLVRGDNAAARGFYEALGYRDVEAACFQKVIA